MREKANLLSWKIVSVVSFAIPHFHVSNLTELKRQVANGKAGEIERHTHRVLAYNI